MNRNLEHAETFHRLHVAGDPLVLVNIWDAGSAKSVADGGATAIATSSWSVAGARGEADGERITLESLLETVSAIVCSVDLPVTVDFESGYSENADGISANITRLIAAGAIGCNLEDGIPGTGRMRSIEEQSARIAAARQAAQHAGIPLFINARTDSFLLASAEQHGAHLAEAKARARAYAAAGANGFFIPGLTDLELIAEIVRSSPVPVNAMVPDLAADLRPFAHAGVARVSFGPSPWRVAMNVLRDAAMNATRRGLAPDAATR